MTIAPGLSSVFSNFYMDGEGAYTSGDTLDNNPYPGGDEAGDAWRAGWLAASGAASSIVGWAHAGASLRAGEADGLW